MYICICIKLGTHIKLLVNFLHPYHCKKGIPYSQALRLNRICSDNKTFGRRRYDLEKWLMERDYNEEMMREQL